MIATKGEAIKAVEAMRSELIQNCTVIAYAHQGRREVHKMTGRDAQDLLEGLRKKERGLRENSKGETVKENSFK